MADDKEMPVAVVDGNEVTGHIISTTIGGKNGEPKQTISYMAERVVGTGSFGIVFQAKCLETGETVAIKKVLQDRRYKNRELQLMRVMDHPNVISLKHCFFSTTGKNKLFLNLVMEYVPESMYRVLKHYSSANQRMLLIYVKHSLISLFQTQSSNFQYLAGRRPLSEFVAKFTIKISLRLHMDAGIVEVKLLELRYRTRSEVISPKHVGMGPKSLLPLKFSSPNFLK